MKQREMIFRAWNEKEKQMSKPFMFSDIGDDRIRKVWSSPRLSFSISDCIVNQFVGLFDKRGKKIFDGDIVEFDNTIMECKWLQSECMFVFYQKAWKETHEVNTENCKECKVIGNVFEHHIIIQ